MVTLKSISKRFGGVRALDNVTLNLRPGEIRGLVGENGAGKSTLMRVLAGVYAPDDGQVLFRGNAISIRDPKHAYDLGIRIVHQELSLLPNLTVTENLFLHRFVKGGLTRVRRQALDSEAKMLLAQWDVDMPVTAKVETVDIGKRQMVEIAREVSKGGKVLILDEPTSSLTKPEIDHLFTVLRRLRDSGMSIVFISHRIHEVLGIADSVSILRNGRNVGDYAARAVSPGSIVSLIAGREIAELFPKIGVPIGDTILTVDHLSGRGFRNVSLQLRRGEILGIAGLVGAGRSELLRCLFGLNPRYNGEVKLGGKTLRILSPSSAIECGMVLLSENRADEGIFAQMSVAKNLILMRLGELTRAGWLRETAARKKVCDLIEKLSIVTHDPYSQLAAQLSGGNQQKVILGRLLGSQPRILLLDEPTRGVDVGTKAEIHRLIGSFAGQGNAAIIVSSEIPELMGTCDRILVLREGSLVGQFARSDFSEEAILRCAMGVVQQL